VAETALDDVFIDDINLPANDGYLLGGSLYLPRRARRNAVLMVGDNQPKSLVGFPASMSEWAARDVTAAVAWMRERYKNLPLRYVGHSFGGQALGLLPNNTEISRALLIAAQAAYWRLMTAPERYRVYVMMNFIGAPSPG
jgi:hypothetical protein